MPRLFYNHHCLLARPDSRYLPRLLNCSLSTVRIPPSYYHCSCPSRRAYLSLDSSSQDKVSTREKSPENTPVHPFMLAEPRLIFIEAPVAKPVLPKAVHSGGSRWIYIRTGGRTGLKSGIEDGISLAYLCIDRSSGIFCKMHIVLHDGGYVGHNIFFLIL